MKSEKSTRRPLDGRWVGALALWITPVLGLGALLPFTLSVDAQSTAPAQAETISVGSRTRDLRMGATLEMGLSPEVFVRSGVGGVITAIYAEPGQPLQTGSPLVAVNGITLLAQVGGTPFYRALQRNTKGPDVGALNTYLANAGFGGIAGNETYDRLTQAAVKQLQASVGAVVDGVFSPELFAYVPSEPGYIEAPLVNVGDVVSPGVELFSSPRQIVSARLYPSDPSKSFAQYDERPIALSYSSSIMQMDGPTVAAADLAVLATLVDQGVSDGLLVLTDSGDTREVTGFYVGLATPLELGTLPGEAIFVGAEGVQCVFQDSPSGVVAVRLSATEIVSFEVGVAYVSAELIGTPVVRNPTVLAEDTRQQCK